MDAPLEDLLEPAKETSPAITGSVLALCMAVILVICMAVTATAIVYYSNATYQYVINQVLSDNTSTPFDGPIR